MSEGLRDARISRSPNLVEYTTGGIVAARPGRPAPSVWQRVRR